MSNPQTTPRRLIPLRVLPLLLLAALLPALLCGCNAASTSSQNSSESESTPFESALPNEGLPEGMEVVRTDLYHPAEIGKWLRFEVKTEEAESPASSAAETSPSEQEPPAPVYYYFRITEILRGTEEVDAAIDDYNAKGYDTRFNELTDDRLEYCLIRYEVYFPENFPAPDDGITDVLVPLRITTETGDTIEHNGGKFDGLNYVYDISVKPKTKTLYPGGTFTEGRGVFAMLKEANDYLIETSHVFGEEQVKGYIAGQ